MLEFAQRERNTALMFVDPALDDLFKRKRVEIMKLLPSLPKNNNQVCILEKAKVLCDGLSRHVEMPAEATQCLAVLLMQLIEQTAPARIGERLEHIVHSTTCNQMVACLLPR